MSEVSVAERVNEVSIAEQENEWVVWTNERTDERVAQYSNLYSWSYWPTVRLVQIHPFYSLSLIHLNSGPKHEFIWLPNNLGRGIHFLLVRKIKMWNLIQSYLIFLDAFSHLYKRVCLSVGPSVRPSVRPSVCHTRVEFRRNGISGPHWNKIASGTSNYAIGMTIKRHLR